MNKSFLALFLADELFPGSDVVRRFSFRMIDTRDSYALLAGANHQLAANFANVREESALFQNKDCFECLSPQPRWQGKAVRVANSQPHKIAA